MLQRSPPDLVAPVRQFLSRNPRLRTGGIVSFAAHVLIFIALLITLPSRKAEEEQEPATSVEMIFDGKARSTIKAPTPAPVPAPAREITPPAPPVTELPKPEPIAGAPPPPPPPPHADPPRLA